MQDMNNGQPDETGPGIVPDPLHGEGYIKPLGELDKPIAEDNRPDPLPMSPVLFGTAKAILTAIYEFGERDSALRAVQLQIDDRPLLKILVELGFATQDDVTDILGITTEGRLFLGLKPEGVLDLPVEVAEVTGNVAERELAARYCEGKIAAIDNAINMGDEPRYMRTVTWQESYEHCALTLRAMASEFRQGLHIPARVIEGRVIPYNEDRGTGISHQNAIRMFFIDVHERNLKAGWWTDIKTGFPMKRNVGEMFILMVTELAEAYIAWTTSEPDDKLPQYPGIGVELGDLAIRLADFCGALLAGRIIMPEPRAFNPGDEMFDQIVDIAKQYESIRKTAAACGEPETADFLPSMDVAVMIDSKLAFNAQREDHKIENRLKEDGKRT